MDSNPIIQKKQLSIKYAGSMQKYEQFKKMMGASPLLYSHDFHFYNDDITTRHQRNAKELQLLRKLLKEGKIETNMLSFNVFNTYYPSYVLHHHYEVFVPILSMFSEREDIKRILTCSRRHVFNGAFFYEKIKLNLKEADKNTPTIDASGAIQMPEDTYFYSGVTSPYITHCAFIAHHESGPRLVVVALRDSEGAFSAGLKVRDLGATTSDDYLPIGYNFSGTKPAALIELTPQIGKKLFSTGMKQRFYEFGYSLKDLQKSLWITVNYTNMRKQFKTIDQSKEERRIITYQAVATRIINGFAQYIAFTDMYSRVVEEGRSHVVLSEILESSHHIILENLIHLRQCCGGFGYMQVSGHPGCIERVCFRAGQEKNKDMKLTPEYLQATQYYASTEESEKYYCQPITAEKPTYMNYFGIFLSIIFNMRRNKGNLSSLQFKREYLRQSSLIAMHAREEFSRSDASNIHCQLLQYAISTYILKNVGFISWELIKIERTAFIDRLEQFRNGFLQFISQNLLSLGETLELSFLRNTIVGRQKSDQFYNQVLTTSKNNLRNDPQYLKEIQAPIIEMITTNRAKL